MRAAYFAPSGQIPGRVMVSMGCMPTPKTEELGLTPTIAFVHKAAATTRPAAVPWVHQDNGDARSLCLVAHKLSQLIEAPGMMLVALAFANRHPVAYPGQVFHGQRGLRVFGMRHKPFRDRMVDGTAEPGFVPGHLFEASFRAFRPRRLVGLSGTPTALSDDFHRCPCVAVPVRVRRQVDDAQVYTQKPGGLNRRFFRRVERHQQKERAIYQRQIGLAFGTVELHPLILTHLHGHHFTTVQRHQADRFQTMKSEDAFIVDDCAIRTKGNLLRFIALVGFDRLGNGPNGQLGRHAKAVAHLVVERFLQDKLGRTPLLIGVGRYPRTGRVKGVHRVQQSRVLLRRREKFDLQCRFHIDVLYHKDSRFVNPLAKAGNVSSTATKVAWIPRPKGRFL